MYFFKAVLQRNPEIGHLRHAVLSIKFFTLRSTFLSSNSLMKWKLNDFA